MSLRSALAGVQFESIQLSPTKRNQFFNALFFGQLLVPLFFLSDVLTAWRVNNNLWWYGFGATGQFVFVFCLLWIGLTLGLFALSRYPRPFSLSRLQGPLVGVYSVIVIVFAFEVILQIIPSGDTPPALWPPVQQALLQPDPGFMPGVKGASTFTGNNVGLRGPILQDDGELYKIVTVGGSTTESLYLDDSEEWPHLVMEGLNASQSDVPVWVGNGGQSGRNAVDHLVLMRTLPVVTQSDLTIFLIGLNDLQPTLAFEGNSTQEILETNADDFGDQVLRGGGILRPTWPVFKRMDLFKRIKSPTAARLAPSSILGHLGVGPGSYIDLRRQMRAGASIVPLPDLQVGLEEYRNRILALAAECKINDMRCLFVTQPSMWRDDLTDREQSLLWFGWTGREFDPVGYGAPSDLAHAMDLYNRALLEVCQEQNLECLDIAPSVPKDISAFYDDVHFNEGGAAIVADLLTEYLLSTPPFSN